MSDSKMFIRYTGQEINPQSACRDNLRVVLDRMAGSNSSQKPDTAGVSGLTGGDNSDSLLPVLILCLLLLSTV
ncbi:MULTISPECIES: hypothetical protein [Enterobacterales]|uniref:Uncharacterized protein n=1 Tax=Citrobacter portucalensis TaxID=1639133 RepID=A0AAJ1JPF7_9ENTR|nr:MULTISPECIES: hypothetical protein [Enterobacteriaceae]EHA3709175.1 hypothetical protein [Citrobacter freundii]EJD6667954.1 hypothetical protein [Citrobacter freundii]MBQ0207077.1 hypothetical protein [Citrobacter freundii]MDE9624330.1 hypothetical protein [Citrobacter portucalensis]